MAGIAGKAGQQMVGRLPLGHNAVVASCTLPCNHSLRRRVLEGGAGPGRGVVAGATWHHCRDMRGGFAWCASTRYMAQGTFLGCTAKYPLNMTGLTIGAHMCAIQRKTGRAMVE